MRLKTTTDACDATDACKEQLLRGGFKTTSSPLWLRIGEDKPGEFYEALFPRGYRCDWFVTIHKGTVVGYKDNGWVDWDWANIITLKLA